MIKVEFSNLYFAQHYEEILELLALFNQPTNIYGYGEELIVTSDPFAPQLGLDLAVELASVNDFPEIYCLVEEQHILQFKLSLP